MKKEDFFIGLSVLLIGLILSIVGFGSSVHDLNKLQAQTMHNITVPCYDRLGNIINNLNCSKEVFDNEGYNGYNGIAKGLSSFILFMCGLIGILFIIASIAFFNRQR